MSKEELEASLKTLDILLIVFGVLVAVGATGASLFGFIQWRKSNQLRAIQVAENLAQEHKIEELRKAANDAAERAANAELLTKELEAEIQPRDLTVEQQREIEQRLGGFTGRILSLRSYSLDTEGKRLGKIIKSVMERSGLQVSDNLGRLTNLEGNIVEGVQIAGPRSQDDLIGALLKSPLGTDKKFKMLRKDDPKIPENALVEILVGVKPIVVAMPPQPYQSKEKP